MPRKNRTLTVTAEQEQFIRENNNIISLAEMERQLGVHRAKISANLDFMGIRNKREKNIQPPIEINPKFYDNENEFCPITGLKN